MGYGGNGVASLNIPDFYQQKYPDGIIGIWNHHANNIMASPVFTLVNSFHAGVPTSGSCPSWSAEFNIMQGANYGSHAFVSYCSIYSVIRIIIIITALFTARSIVFGG